ncbi:MAG: hypothetical protein AUJ98_03675 [Bacteroidetes bacterium CG2_30_33_31]|nr:MAG: hypothetical protein AUJ98_03675 [Bacteroidetes bacterium CG2_30_33_31]
MDIRDKNSVITEWLLKAAVIIFVASMFFEEFIVNTLGSVGGLNLGFLVKIILILIYSLALSVLEKNIFKIAAFATIIVGSTFKILIFISQVVFRVLDIIDLADYFLLISVSIYYLSRHFRHVKSSKVKDVRPKDLTFMKREDAYKEVNSRSANRHHHHSHTEEEQ